MLARIFLLFIYSCDGELQERKNHLSLMMVGVDFHHETMAMVVAGVAEEEVAGQVDSSSLAFLLF